ncbi:MAG: methionine--tRNA ligase subunit beta [bacterium]|nr:methionine--tRNA ligase subunit beta [bacterium]
MEEESTASATTATITAVAEPATDEAQQVPVKEDSLIDFEQFLKVKLRVGQILAAEKIAKSNKLMKLSVDVGEDSGPRQIVAGIAKHYEAENLIGRKVAVVVNLKPAKLMGHESHGMLLAASDDLTGLLQLVTPGSDIPPGGRIS